MKKVINQTKQIRINAYLPIFNILFVIITFETVTIEIIQYTKWNINIYLYTKSTQLDIKKEKSPSSSASHTHSDLYLTATKKRAGRSKGRTDKARHNYIICEKKGY